MGLDNFNDYYPVSLKRARAQALVDMGVPVVELDLNDQEGLGELFRLCSFTHVLHLAAQAGVRYAARNPFAYIQSNIAASVSLMETMRLQKPMPLLVYASSSSVYGLSKRFPFTEDDRADRPASLYAATKRSLELLAHSYFNIYRMSVTGERIGRRDGDKYRVMVVYMLLKDERRAGRRGLGTLLRTALATRLRCCRLPSSHPQACASSRCTGPGAGRTCRSWLFRATLWTASPFACSRCVVFMVRIWLVMSIERRHGRMGHTGGNGPGQNKAGLLPPAEP